ncbi:MAG: AIR synthase family protein, partial [Candidatus Bathyarchaeia archaeon]
MRLPKGKIPADILSEVVFKRLGEKREDIILGPSLGEDGAIIRVGDRVIVSAMDPITGAVERIGWLAVNINANDIATFGVRPAFYSSCILLPENSGKEVVQTICSQMHLAAKKLGIAIIGGHCEVTPQLPRPIVIGCGMGVTESGRYVTSSGSKPGDLLILTKGAGVEGTAILADERKDLLMEKLGEPLVRSAEAFYNQISVVEEAILAFETGGVTAMHDPTEGGIAGGIHELADAADLGFKIYEEKIPIALETSEICHIFGIDPLQLIGSGALLISVNEDRADEVVRNIIDRGIKASIIGKFLEDPHKRVMIHKDGSERKLIRPVSDHLWLALE